MFLKMSFMCSFMLCKHMLTVSGDTVQMESEHARFNHAAIVGKYH